MLFRSLTHFDSKMNHNANYTRCNGGTKFQNIPIVSLNGNSLNNYFTISKEERIDTQTGLPYVNIIFKNFNFTGSASDPVSNIIKGNYDYVN